MGGVHVLISPKRTDTILWFKTLCFCASATHGKQHVQKLVCVPCQQMMWIDVGWWVQYSREVNNDSCWIFACACDKGVFHIVVRQFANAKSQPGSLPGLFSTLRMMSRPFSWPLQSARNIFFVHFCNHLSFA